MTESEDQLRRLHEASFQWALHCTRGRRQDAEDALQDAYEALLDGSARFQKRSSFKSFLFGVIRNKARSLRRRGFVRRLVALDDIEELSVEARGSKDIEQHEQNRAIRRALATLSPKQRDVLELVFFHHLTIQEASVAMGVRLGTARTHYKRAKRALHRHFEDGEYKWLTTISS